MRLWLDNFHERYCPRTTGTHPGQPAACRGVLESGGGRGGWQPGAGHDHGHGGAGRRDGRGGVDGRCRGGSVSNAFAVPEPEPEPLGVDIVGVPDVAVAGESYELTAQSDEESLVYAWRVAGGALTPDTAETVVWTAPATAGVAWIHVDVTREDGAKAGQSAYVRVEVPEPEPEPVPALPLLGQLLLALGLAGAGAMRLVRPSRRGGERVVRRRPRSGPRSAAWPHVHAQRANGRRVDHLRRPPDVPPRGVVLRLRLIACVRRHTRRPFWIAVFPCPADGPLSWLAAWRPRAWDPWPVAFFLSADASAANRPARQR